MAHDDDQRNSRRIRENARIKFSHFNKIRFHKAQILNFGDEGMCFRSDVSLAPGAIVRIQLKNFPPHITRGAESSGLRCLTLAETKWCQEVADETRHYYRIGVKYFPSWY